MSCIVQLQVDGTVSMADLVASTIRSTGGSDLILTSSSGTIRVGAATAGMSVTMTLPSVSTSFGGALILAGQSAGPGTGGDVLSLKMGSLSMWMICCVSSQDYLSSC